jgi:aminoglycoside 6'-N-acetyltransferase I
MSRRDFEVRSVTAADAKEWVEILLAVTDDGAPLGFAELSIRNVVDGCSTDRVAYLEGWYVVPTTRRQGIGRALVQAVRTFRKSLERAAENVT